jgi:hypothetical protein
MQTQPGDGVGDATEKRTANVMPPASVYNAIDDLWIVTSYFNPAGYQSRRCNYERFRQPISAGGLHLLTVECAFGDDCFTLPEGRDVIHVRCRDVMWQKERLVNLVIGRLPRACTKVAWVDADTLFAEPGWAVATSRLLDGNAVVQPYDTAWRLSKDWTPTGGDAEATRGFAAAQAADPDSLRSGDYQRHGETGLAWAARRSVLEDGGLYDACIIGGGDHVMAHVMCGDWDSVCIDRLIGLTTPQVEHLRRWGERFSRQVGGAMGVVPGAALHLWHGEWADRRYSARHRELAAFGFDPDRDLRIGASGCWEWASDKPQLHAWAAAYFAARREDGTPGDSDGRIVAAQDVPYVRPGY